MPESELSSDELLYARMLTHFLHDDMYRDLELIEKAYERFSGRTRGLAQSMQRYERDHPEIVDGSLPRMASSGIQYPLQILRETVEARKAGRSPAYSNVEIAAAIAFFFVTSEHLEELEREDKLGRMNE